MSHEAGSKVSIMDSEEFREWLRSEINHDPEDGGSVFESLDRLNIDEHDDLQALYLIYLKGAGKW